MVNRVRSEWSVWTVPNRGHGAIKMGIARDGLDGTIVIELAAVPVCSTLVLRDPVPLRSESHDLVVASGGDVR